MSVYEIEVGKEVSEEEVKRILKENKIECSIRETFSNTFQELDDRRLYDSYMAAG